MNYKGQNNVRELDLESMTVFDALHHPVVAPFCEVFAKMATMTVGQAEMILNEHGAQTKRRSENVFGIVKDKSALYEYIDEVRQMILLKKGSVVDGIFNHFMTRLDVIKSHIKNLDDTLYTKYHHDMYLGDISRVRVDFEERIKNRGDLYGAS